MISVHEECKRLGISNKTNVTESIQKVMEFFFHGKSLHGKDFSKKSENKVHDNKGSKKSSDLLDDIENTSDQRVEESPMVVSCDRSLKDELFSAVSEPYLVVTSDDLNSCSFSNELGKLFLHDNCTLFLETSNLTKLGTERLQVILKELKTLFDNRVRVIMFGDPCFETMSEKRFVKCTSGSAKEAVKRGKTPSPHLTTQDVSSGSANEEVKRRKTSSPHLSNQGLVDVSNEGVEAISKLAEAKSKLAEAKDNLKKAVQEKNDLDQRVIALVKENALLLGRVEEFKERTFLLENDLSKNKNQIVNVVHSETQTSQQKSNSIFLRDIGSQTKKVQLLPSPLASFVTKFDQDSTSSTKTKVFACIKNFACNIQNTKQASGKFCCKVKITKGQHIMEYSNLLNFEAESLTMEEAKERAFELFVAKVRVEADK